jgi:hypothetical protein
VGLILNKASSIALNVLVAGKLPYKVSGRRENTTISRPAKIEDRCLEGRINLIS